VFERKKLTLKVQTMKRETMKKKVLSAGVVWRKCVLLAVMGLLGGCGGSGGEETEATLVATTGMVGDVVRAVAGDGIHVEVLMGSGVDPHQYQLTRADVVELEGARIIWYNGLMLEGKMEDTLERMAGRGRDVVGLAAEVLAGGGEALDGEDGLDPHVWMDVGLWLRAVDVVEQQLVEWRPAEAAGFGERAEAYREQLRELDNYIREIVATVPEKGRVLVTAHDAFGYFGRAYGVEVHGIQGLSTESEAGLRRIGELVSMLIERRLPAVFVESSVADKNVRALVEGAAAGGHEVAIGGELFSDAMGPAGSYEGSYIGMMDHNATTLVRALGGQAPEGGMQGKLGQGAR
jgi:manganese/zinc/iron transport system substrate-binding protein